MKKILIATIAAFSLSSCAFVDKQLHKHKIKDEVKTEITDNSTVTTIERTTIDTVLKADTLIRETPLDVVIHNPVTWEDDNQVVTVKILNGQLHTTAVVKPRKVQGRSEVIKVQKNDIHTEASVKHEEAVKDKQVERSPTMFTQLWWLWIILVIALIVWLIKKFGKYFLL